MSAQRIRVDQSMHQTVHSQEILASCPLPHSSMYLSMKHLPILNSDVAHFQNTLSNFGIAFVTSRPFMDCMGSQVLLKTLDSSQGKIRASSNLGSPTHGLPIALPIISPSNCPCIVKAQYMSKGGTLPCAHIRKLVVEDFDKCMLHKWSMPLAAGSKHPMHHQHCTLHLLKQIDQLRPSGIQTSRRGMPAKSSRGLGSTGMRAWVGEAAAAGC